MAMKGLFIALALTTSALAAAQVPLTVSVGGQQIGTGTYESKRTPNGGLEIRFAMRLQVGERTFAMSSVDRYDRRGVPLAEENMADTPSATQDRKSIVYGPRSARLMVVEKGKRTTRTVAYPKGASILQPSVLWFVRDRPKVGQRETHWSYSLGEMKWNKRTATYKGPKEVVIGDRRFKAHHISGEDVDLYVDDKGDVVRAEIQEGGTPVILERRVAAGKA
jgi:hypothetical protein